MEEIARGLIERMSKPRIVVSPPMKKRSKKGTVESPNAWTYSPRSRKPNVLRPLLIHRSAKNLRYSTTGRTRLKSPPRNPPAIATDKVRLDPLVGLK